MKINDIINNGNKIIIYGTGNYGKLLFSYLCMSGFVENIEGFSVSREELNNNSLFNKPVFTFQTINTSLYSVILAMGEKNSNEIRQTTSKALFDTFYQLTTDDYEYMNDFIFKVCCSYPLDMRKVFFSSFGGRGYSCNCKYVAEHLNKRNSEMKLIWETDSFRENTERFELLYVQIGSPEYYMAWYTSGIAVCNNVINSSLMKRKGQYIINTWHGIGPTKKIGLDVECDKANEGTVEYLRRTFGAMDLMTAASNLCIRNYREALLYKGEIMKSGYPRNDIFFREDKEELAASIREKLGISADELMVLYAPTYRYEQRQGAGSLDEMKQRYELPWREVKLALAHRFSKPPRLVYRFHHVTDRGMDVHGRFPDGIDATDYPDMQELLLAADILITDYSSSMWDFSLQRKPAFLFYNDADEVEKEVGFYLHPDKYPYPKGHTSEELCHAIEAFDNEKYQQDLDKWFETYGTYDDGHASERVVERIIDVMDHPEKYGKVE